MDLSWEKEANKSKLWLIIELENELMSRVC